MNFGDWAIRKLTGQAAPLRGRVHKVSVVRGGEVSVVVRFGVEEPKARELNQGALLELDVVAEAPPVPVKKPRTGQRYIVSATDPPETFTGSNSKPAGEE